MTAAAIKVYPGSALFSFGFRPFFIFGTAWAGLAVPAWALAYIRGGGTVLGAPGRDWHVHEMLFGYLAAVIAGFLLTAVPNWTGRPPITGRPLIALFGLWVAGRVAMLLQARLGAVAAAIDAMFPGGVRRRDLARGPRGTQLAQPAGLRDGDPVRLGQCRASSAH